MSEVDFILVKGKRIIAVEVKSGTGQCPGTRSEYFFRTVQAAPWNNSGRPRCAAGYFPVNRPEGMVQMSTEYYAPRTCYEIIENKQRRERNTVTHTLEALRECPAYVLLGQPGIGKTTAFKQEATQPNYLYIEARKFITPDIKPEWENKTLFIDGLDEVRAGKDDVLFPLDQIHSKLDQLGSPKFRLSCREADWYGKYDNTELKKVSPDSEIKELYLVELTDDDLHKILIKNYDKTADEASSFLEEAQRRDLMDLINNPQILGMLVAAVGEENDWPESKSDIFKLACEKLLMEERNLVHDIAYRNQRPPCEELMLASGMLCAVMLLARKQGFALLRSDVDVIYPHIADMADNDPGILQLVARTRLFTIHKGHAEYRHRIFAEYLSAYYLSNKIDNERIAGRTGARPDDGNRQRRSCRIARRLCLACHALPYRANNADGARPAWSSPVWRRQSV